MIAQDLRPGNIIYQNSKHGYVGEDVIIDVLSDSVCTESNDQLPLKCVEGVQLTAEFIEDKKINENSLDFRIKFIERDGNFYPYIYQAYECGTTQKVSLNSIQFIHEFQNLIYILTGQIV